HEPLPRAGPPGERLNPLAPDATAPAAAPTAVRSAHEESGDADAEHSDTTQGRGGGYHDGGRAGGGRHAGRAWALRRLRRAHYLRRHHCRSRSWHRPRSLAGAASPAAAAELPSPTRSST